MADRDEILRYAADLLDLDSYPDYGPMGLQVVGSATVTRIACGVSASRRLFERAAEEGAELLLVHHGLLWDNEPRTIGARMKDRLKALFAADITLAAYHLALDAHPEIGNNALLARELGVTPERQFAKVGLGGTLREPAAIDDLVQRIKERVNPDPIVFAHGPVEIRRVAIVSGGAAKYVVAAAEEAYDAFLTGEPDEPAMHNALEGGIHFVAAGHYATETLGIQALARHLAERFGTDWVFVDLPNPV